LPAACSAAAAALAGGFQARLELEAVVLRLWVSWHALCHRLALLAAGAWPPALQPPARVAANLAAGTRLAVAVEAHRQGAQLTAGTARVLDAHVVQASKPLMSLLALAHDAPSGPAADVLAALPAECVEPAMHLLLLGLG
jgi:hypothetical protein